VLGGSLLGVRCSLLYALGERCFFLQTSSSSFYKLLHGAKQLGVRCSLLYALGERCFFLQTSGSNFYFCPAIKHQIFSFFSFEQHNTSVAGFSRGALMVITLVGVS